MKRTLTLAIALSLMATGCTHKQQSISTAKPTAFGAAIVETSGGKQIAPAGTLLPQPVVVQVNDEQGNGVAGARLSNFTAPLAWYSIRQAESRTPAVNSQPTCPWGVARTIPDRSDHVRQVTQTG